MDTSRFRVRPGEMVRLRRRATDDTRPFKHKRKAVDKLKRGLERLVKLQELFYAENRWSLLLVFQGMDAAGKDSAIKHVMSGLNPQGTQVYSFKRPSDEELDHDYLWRSAKALPERGRIGIFNRSYYEEVLVVKVHPEILAAENLPPPLVTPRIWTQRYEDINAFERHLSRSRRRSSGAGCSSGWTSRRRTGSFNRAIWTSAINGMTTSAPTSRCSRRPARDTRRGSSCRRITNGSRASRSPT